MGGAYGHISHVWENTDLTFAELKELLVAAACGRLEGATEKTDGMNLVFTWHSGSGRVKVARGVGDIRQGGLDAGALAAKFAGRGNVHEAFVGAFKALNDALAALPDKTKLQAFGPDGSVWYSMEVISATNTNVIGYDKNCIVFHAHGSFTVGAGGLITQAPHAPGVEVLERNISRMQSAVAGGEWSVVAPQVVKLRQLDDGGAISSAISAISAAQASVGVSDADTIGTYLQRLVKEAAEVLGLEADALDAVVARVLEAPGAPSLNALKKLVPQDRYDAVNRFVKASPALLKRLIRPIEHAVHGLSVEVLRGVRSAMVVDHDSEVSRLRRQVSRAIEAIEASGNERAMNALRSELLKLRSADDVSSSVEGIVFRFKGRVYKLTGNFAPINQILGYFKYGRHEIKLTLGPIGCS